MSTQTEITRLTTARNTIRTKLVALGLATSTSKLDELATVVNGIENRGAVTVEVKEGETYTIPKGYHNGSGTVSGVAGGGNYSLQSKTVTPTKSQQNITPDVGSYGLSDVTVEAIPENFQDVTAVTATAADVLATKNIVDAEGKIIAGTMPNNGAVEKNMYNGTGVYFIPQGYHNGNGKVGVFYEDKTVTPTKSTQVISGTSVSSTEKKYLGEVTVNPIPDEYITTDDANATSSAILAGYTAYVDGEKVTGGVPVHSPTNVSLTVASPSYDIPYGVHPRGAQSTVTVSSTAKSATPTKSAQLIKGADGEFLSQVTVTAIPDEYQDVTEVTALANAVLTGYKFVNSDGEVIEGTMAHNGVINVTIDGLTTTSYKIPAGYTSGGQVTLDDSIETALAAI